MAKATQQQAELPESTSLAERLFAANWTPNSGYTPESVAAKCLEAAEAFERAKAERAGLRIANTA